MGICPRIDNNNKVDVDIFSEHSRVAVCLRIWEVEGSFCRLGCFDKGVEECNDLVVFCPVRGLAVGEMRLGCPDDLSRTQ